MKIRIQITKKSIVFFLLLSCITSIAQQIVKPAVLELIGGNNYTTHFDTQNRLTTQLLNTGVKGQATVEFWIKGSAKGTNSTYSPWLFSNLLTGSEEFSVMGSQDEILVKLGSTEYSKIPLEGSSKLKNNKWHHIALTFNVPNATILLYIDGIQQARIPYTNLYPELVYLMITSDDKLSIAEYRAWNRERTRDQIKENRFISYYDQNQTNLSILLSDGLVAAYSNNNFIESIPALLPISDILWYNMITDKTNPKIPTSSHIVSAVNRDTSTRLAEMRIDGDHPIFGLEDVLLTVSDGNGSKLNNISGGKPGIVLKWPHINGVTSYTISRRNVNVLSSLPRKIDSKDDTSGVSVSTYLDYFDDKVLPNEVYEYTVTSNLDRGKAGIDNGFVFSNGTIKGAIATANGIASQNTLVEATTELGIPGSALQFDLGSDPIGINDVTIFQNTGGKGSIEFWYRTPQIAKGENTVFKLGAGEIHMGSTAIKVMLRNSQLKEYLSATKPDDTEWHHYIFTYDTAGGSLYIDGGIMPTDGAKEITPNAVTSAIFDTALNKTSMFSFNEVAQTTYQIDEIRIWGEKRTPIEINKFKNYVLSGIETGLMAYYRLDLQDKNNIYNQAEETIGRLKGISLRELKRLPKTDQPLSKYGTYTDSNGQYVLNNINAGTQNDSGNSMTYVVNPSKPNSKYSPENRIVDIDRVLSPKTKNADFTDISSLPISGRVVYRVPDENSFNIEEYPTVKNTGIKLNGTIVTSNDPTNELVRTNREGVYTISTPLGRHTISVGGIQTGKDETVIGGEDRVSLDFNGVDGYAVLKNKLSVKSTDSFTWSGFVKPDITTTLGATDSKVEEALDIKIPPIQTILHWGDIRLELRDNEQFVLLVKEEEVLNKVITQSSQYTFFAIVGNATDNTIGLYIDKDLQKAAYSGVIIDNHAYLGVTNSETEKVNFSRANIDILEYRTQAYTTDKLSKIKRGEVITEDIENLKLSYTFEDLKGRRAINLAVDSDTNNTENNFLSLHGGASFDNKSTSGYRRDFAFQYKAIEGDNVALINPENPTEYLFNITEAVSGIDFENTTRRSFIGNIVIPCDNSVGAWSGIIERTDVAFPKFSKSITEDNFNTDQTVFVVNNLLPGQYKISLTKPGLTSPLTASVDLRSGNKSYDFSYRNPLQTEVQLYSITIEEFKKITEIEDLKKQEQELNSLLNKRKIEPTCGTDTNIYSIKTGENILVKVSLFEDYNGSRCPVEGASVSLSGDMIKYPLESTTNAAGVESFGIFISNPNFIGNHLRSLHIAASHSKRNLNQTVSAYITGSERNNADFTLTNPIVGYILYDPPGDNSSATLESGSTYTYSSTWSKGVDVKTNFTTGTGIDANVTSVILAMTAPLGVGTAQGISTMVGKTVSSIKGKVDANFNYKHIGVDQNSVSLSSSISTPSYENETIVGADADVFIGTSQVLTFGGGRELKINSCTPIVEEKSTVVTADDQTPFVYTRQDIEDRVIRNLQELLIKEYDEVHETTAEEKAARSSLDYQSTINGFNINKEITKTNSEIANYNIQINKWKQIVKRKTREEQLNYINKAPSFASTTSDLKKYENGNSLGVSVSEIDQQISFSGGDVSTKYSLTRTVDDSGEHSVGGVGGFTTLLDTKHTILGVNVILESRVSTLAETSGSFKSENGISRTDSFTLSDNDVGDHFSVKIARDPKYDTAMFYTVAGQSNCPFESGTQPREGVEIVTDKTVGYGTGESITYKIKLRNTQKANDKTRKTYYIKTDIASNNEGSGAIVELASMQISKSESAILFDLDEKSPTGVKQEIEHELRISKGKGAPENISYKDLKIQFYTSCENNNDGYRKYRVDEYEEVGVKPFQEIFLTAHFTGACVKEIESKLPQENWVVNSTDNNKLDFRFKIPELVSGDVNDKFSVLIEYAIPGNNEPTQLKKLTLEELTGLMDKDSEFINYKADVSGLVDGTYLFRVTPLCDDGGANLPQNRQTPTEYVKGTIAREAPVVVSTNPKNGGILTDGQISVAFNRDINPLTVVRSAISLRGILGGVPADLISANFEEIADEVRVPHQTDFDLTGAFTIEMWVNPSSLPTADSVPILQKGDNYTIALTSNGAIKINDKIIASKVLQPFTWTHVSAIYDGVSTLTIYYNGVSVGSGTIQNLESNTDPIYIAKNINGNSYIGKLDEVRIWSIDRNPTQIVSNMKEQLVGNETNLEAYFVFDENALEGENGVNKEAIRDFTGHAVGTTAVGLSFVRGEDNAAPLDITRIAKDIDFITVTSKGNTEVQINPVFTDVEIEGAQLTAIIHNEKLEDPNGNKIKGSSWSFTVNRNTIQWNHNNIEISQAQGKSTRITEMFLDNKNGGIAVNYKFVRLPNWLTVEKRTGSETFTKIEENSEQNISAGHIERNLEFVVAPYLNPGIYTANIYIETYNASTGVPTGTEVFKLQVHVFCSAPNFSEGFNASNYIGNMRFVGKLKIGEVESVDTEDIVAVYFNDEYRGSAKVNRDGIVNVSVSGSPSDSGALTFKVWDASECTEYQGIVENYVFEIRKIKGTSSNPVTFTVGDKLVRRISLVKGYQLVSFNVRDNKNTNNLNLSSIKELVSGDQILDAISYDIIATVNTKRVCVPYGNIRFLDVTKSYLINTSASRIIEVIGVPVDLNTDITIYGGEKGNAIPYYPSELQRMGYALRSLRSTTISDGDIIEHRDLSAEYSSEKGWRGSLTHLTPGLGYLYTSTNDGVLNYTGIAKDRNTMVSSTTAKSSKRMIKLDVTDISATQNNILTSEEVYAQFDYERKAKAIGWKVNTSQYPVFMHVNAVLKSDEIEVDRPYIIAAFINNEVRGVAKSELIDGEYRYYLGIGGFSSEDISFKIFDGNSVLTLDNMEKFDRSIKLGNIDKPYALNYSLNKTSKSDGNVLGYSLKQNIPNPMTHTAEIKFSVPKSTHVDISLYNILGQKVATLISKKVEGNKLHKIYWDKDGNNKSLKSGIYMYKLSADDKVMTKKLIIN